MKISSRFTVATHILSLIAMEEPPLTSLRIAASVNTNPVVIRRISGQLKNAGLIAVKAGSGGATLLKPLTEITLLEVYKAVDSVEDGELFQFHENPNPNCQVGAHIQDAMEQTLIESQKAMEQVLANRTMADVVDTIRTEIAE
ncbi:Rrf2 family transcriptional regulator [Listeria booriae]|uniref:Rrf2 family transcriptional regulator n=1 Tax=Listeria booriae TaxID=1552123 RepID=UPI0016255C14|nr:Rrf2 family transcriptional regulator [Listeria booriae]MBC1890995.1 Rrf2 family transcriptional regulator [Listeria booriae]MBC1897114.1 Rrf2 family transcriptional regulator [Listeria booriae]MBC1911185.1 Rrf2 family transcriptional regulator [Listeria booriae]